MKSNLLTGRRGYISRVEHVDVSAARSVSAWLKSFVMAAVVCLAVPMAKAADSLTVADFAHKIKLQVSGYTGNTTLTDFPVLVRIAAYNESTGKGIAGFSYSDTSAWNSAHTKTYGYDVAFFAEDGTRLASEIDTWVHGGESLAWVKLPSMTQETKFWMCYNVADGVMVENLNPWDGYVGVWHLKDEGGTSKPIKDSTVNALDGTTVAEGSPSSVADGRIGNARHITTSDKNSPGIDSGITINLSDSAKRAVVDGLGTEFMASMWVRVTANFNYFYLISRKDKDECAAWGVQTQNSMNGSIRLYSAGTTDAQVASPKLATALAALNQWHKIDFIWKSDGTYEIYQDGGNKLSGDLYNKLPAAQGSLNLSLGGALQPDGNPGAKIKGGRGLNGDMDEVRLRPGVVSADWVKADYDTVVDESFVTKAPPEYLSVIWTGTEGVTPGLKSFTHKSAVFAGRVEALGDLASSCEIQYKVWAAGESEPEGWTTLAGGLVKDAVFEVPVAGLARSTSYSYALRADNGVADPTVPVTGTFTTASGLTVAWSDASGSPGVEQVQYGHIVAGGTVAVLGDATKCNILYKVWADGEPEPEVWTTLASNLVLGDSYSENVLGLKMGTAYHYTFMAVGDADGESAEVSGTFTTPGSAEETVGSDYTHFFDDGTNAVWVVDEYERFLPFTVTGYTGTETLTNFPVLVDVRAADTNGFDYADFYHYDGQDIAFVDEKGHIIPHEIDTWNKNGMSLIWVRLPEMKNGTTFTMCYRSPLLQTPPDPGNTFERYVGVWHMAEAGNGVVDLKDSTVNGLTAETHAQSLETGIAGGRIGRARRVAQSPGSSSSFGRIIAFDKGDILRTGVGNVFTYSGWYKLHEKPPKWAYLVARKTDDQNRGWGIQYEESSTKELRVWSGSAAKGAFQKFATQDTGTSWNYWTFVYDGSVNPDGTTNQLFHAYLNGTELASTAGGFNLDYDVANDETAGFDHLVIGGVQNGTGAFNGLVDECRYSKGMRSADWIKAEYDSMLQVNTPFVTKGAQVSHGKDSLVPVVVWERGAGLPDTILDVSYAYVQFAGTVTYCGAGADRCRIEYQLWPDGEQRPAEWTTLRANLEAGMKFSIPVTGLKQDMLYNFSIRAVNVVDGQERQNHEHEGQFRTNGNVTLGDVDGELFRVGDRFVHRYRTGYFTFTTPDYVTNVEIMVVGGGGAGGYKVGGGGGGGGLFYSQSFPVTTNTVYKINVGQGGTAPADTSTPSQNGNGEESYFALESDEGNPLIIVPGGGGGGSYASDEGFSAGADGASGGGGTYAKNGGEPTSGEVGGVSILCGHKGGQGNDSLVNGSLGKVAAGGGGGAGRAGLSGTFDQWSAGGAGGVGVSNSMTGETLHYGAGGGGGYIYRYAVNNDGSENFTKPGGGGSGIGGDAADVRNGTLATSGVANTGAGGGGGSSMASSNGIDIDGTDSTYWQGGNGGDGVVLISYVAHGRDPISDDPRITMNSCDYTDEKGYADIVYRAYWAGIQAHTNDIYVLYSPVSSNDVAAGNGELARIVDESTIGIGEATFTPPAVGYTYWVRLVARKEANSFMYSDEIASFEVPAIRLNGVTWHMPNAETNTEDYATVIYNLYDTAPDARLYCYWSENREELEGDEAPTGSSVHFLDLGTGRQTTGLYDATFDIPASEGLERNKTYYIRLATGNEAGTRYFLSHLIVELETIDKPRVIFPEAVWANHLTTVKFLLTTSDLDPATVELVALYTGNEADAKDSDPMKNKFIGKAGVNAVSLGSCAAYPDDIETETQFPLWSSVNTNFYMRLALVTNNVPICYSQRYQTLDLISAVPTNTLLIYANADPKIGCYGEAQQELTYTQSYGGYTTGPGWDHWQSINGSLTGALACDASSTSPTGQYSIVQGTLGLSNQGATYVLPRIIDQDTGEVVQEETSYYYELIYTGSKYTVTNAHFTASIEDVAVTYTGDLLDIGDLPHSETGVVNNQPVTYRYNAGSGEWSDTVTTTYSDIGTHIIQFKATAPNHDETCGTFTITVEPAPLSAAISAEDLSYLGIPQIPVVTTNVTGHVRPDLNPLTVEFRDEADEWQGTVPAFTLPGTYRLFFRVSAPNHTPFTTNCTFTVEEWDYKVNMDGKDGFEVPINISDPAWLLRVTGEDVSYFADNTDNNRYKNLDRVCDNGLKLWQNYLIDRTDLSKRLVAAIRQSGDRVNENSFVVYFPNVSVLRNAGLDVAFRLDRKLKGESVFTKGELSDKYEMNVPLGPGDPTGLYVFNIVLTPTNDVETGEAMYGGGESVMASIATVGVIRVSSALTNTVTVAPWKSLTVGTEEAVNVSVSDVINPNSGISDNDMILAYNTATSDFNAWSRSKSRGDEWLPLTTVSKNGMSVSEAETNRFALGKAFWLVRSEPDDYIYLVGRYTGEDYVTELAGGTADAPGHTLAANPTMNDIDLNSMTFVDGNGDAATPAVGDRIVTQDLAGLQLIHFRNAANSMWGYYSVTTNARGRVQNKWTSGGTIPAGTGFWYTRTAETPLRIKFEAEK